VTTIAQRTTVKRAAELTGMSTLTVRYGLETGRLPFGTSIKRSQYRTIYHVCPHKLAEYLGIPVEEVLKKS
jgi:hypothetical protein